MEVASQADRRLSRSRAAIPRGLQRRRRTSEKIKQRIWIARPEGGVCGGNSREMIREAHSVRRKLCSGQGERKGLDAIPYLGYGGGWVYSILPLHPGNALPS